jgi:hypothetical protein
MANDQGFTSVGAFIEVASALPTSQATAAGFSNVTDWKEVGGVDTIGEIKKVRATSSRTALKTGDEHVVGGAANYEPFTVDGAIVRGDEGQGLLDAHLDSGANISWRVTYGDGGTQMGVALITSGGNTPGDDPTAFAGMAYELKPSGNVVKTAPAP